MPLRGKSIKFDKGISDGDLRCLENLRQNRSSEVQFGSLPGPAPAWLFRRNSTSSSDGHGTFIAAKSTSDCCLDHKPISLYSGPIGVVFTWFSLLARVALAAFMHVGPIAVSIPL